MYLFKNDKIKFGVGMRPLLSTGHNLTYYMLIPLQLQPFLRE